jgi:glycosyltransferase involved in cell wall biosynthesis
MKTLHVDTGREMRGGQWQVLYLIERLADDAVLLAPEGSGLFASAREKGLHVRPLSFATLARSARQTDLVHTHDARAHTLAAVAGGRPLVVSRRVGFPVKSSMASRWKYRRAALYLAVSKFAASKLREAGVSESKIRVVYDGVPVPAPGRPQPGRVVALASKPAEVPGIPIHLSTDLWQDLSTASIFVYSSEMEGLGSAALAAMACGVPVIASRVGGLPEIVEHERTGLLIEPGELPVALRTLLDHPAAAREMGCRGRELVKEKFTAEAMLAATLRAYGEIPPC